MSTKHFKSTFYWTDETLTGSTCRIDFEMDVEYSDAEISLAVHSIQLYAGSYIFKNKFMKSKITEKGLLDYINTQLADTESASPIQLKKVKNISIAKSNVEKVNTINI